MSQTEKCVARNLVEDIHSERSPPYFCERKRVKNSPRNISDGPKQNAIAVFWQNVLMAQETKEPQDEEKYILLGHNHD